MSLKSTIDLPVSPTMHLGGRRALVTGAGRGIGLAAAAALAEAGADVCLVARTLEEVEAAATAMRARGNMASAFRLDVTDRAATDDFVQAQGPFQILVNNAGTNRPSTLMDLREEDYDAVTDLNVKAAIFVARAVIKGLLESGLTGSIINVSSQMGHVGGPRRTVYCATKHAVEGMTRALAWEVGRQGIRVNTVCPTFIETEMTAPMLREPGFREAMVERIALGRLGRIEDLMGAFVFLAGDASALVTGSSLMVDGGWTAA